MSDHEDDAQQEQPEAEEQDPLVERQQGKGYGEDEGEREQALPGE